MKASFKRMKSGDWGIKVEGDHQTLQPGQTVTVTKKSGETKDVVVEAVMYTDEECALCTIVSDNKVGVSAPF